MDTLEVWHPFFAFGLQERFLAPAPSDVSTLPVRTVNRPRRTPARATRSALPEVLFVCFKHKVVLSS